MYTNIGQEVPMKKRHSDVKSRLYSRICASAPGRVWTAADFADFGPRDAVDKTLQRLAATGNLRRIDWGLYDRPHTNELTGKPSAPDYRAVVEAIARRDQTRILVDGMTAANDLGLSDAVPGRVVVHSDARLKPIRLDNLTITFRPTAASKLYWAGRPGMRIVQALNWLKPKFSNPEESQRIRRRFQAILWNRDGGPALRKDLKKGLTSMPAWMQDFLREMISNDSSSSANVPVRKRKVGRRKADSA
jgi:hypothetical protein